MKIRYKAATKEGKLTRGLLDAKGMNEAVDYLRQKDLIPVTIDRIDNKFWEDIPFLSHRVGNAEIVLFTRQLSSMLASGLTLLRSLEILREQMENPSMQEVVSSVVNDIEEGKSMADGMSKHPKVFSQIYISIIKAGEQSGLLDKVLARLADNLEEQAKLRNTVKSALMYPVIVLILMAVVMAVMMIFVMPQLTVLYSNLNVPLPLPTQIVVGLSNFMISAWYLVILFGVIFYIAFNKWAATTNGRLILDTLFLKIPVFGRLISLSILAEFARTFGLLVGTGTLVVQALLETADTTGNVLYRKAIQDVSKQVEKGVTIGDAMSSFVLFPPLMIQLVKVGEQTGKIDETLVKASEYFEREVNLAVKGLTTAMEPFIMIILGIGVAFLVISVISPIYTLISSIQ